MRRRAGTWEKHGNGKEHGEYEVGGGGAGEGEEGVNLDRGSVSVR